MVVYIFCIGSVLGWIMEITYKLFAGQDYTTAGMTKGPFCITYGFAATLLYLTVYKVTGNIIYIFLLSTVLLTIVELISGIVLDKILKITLWDYKGLKLYINKYICGEFMILWGVLGTIFVKFLLPLIIYFLTNIDKKITLYISLIIIGYMLVDYILTILKQIKKKYFETQV